MTQLLPPILLLVGLVLIALGAVGRMLRPSDGRWTALKGGTRLTLVVLGLLALALSWRVSGGRFAGEQPVAAAPRVWTAAGRPDQPGGARLSADAERAQRGAVPQPDIEPPVLAAVATDAAPPPPPSGPATQPVAPAAAVPLPPPAPLVAAAAAQAPSQAPPCKPCDESARSEPSGRASATATAPAAKAAAAAPRRSRPAQPAAVPAGYGDVVSVCELQMRYRGSDREVAVPAALPPRGAGSVTLRNRLGPGQRREVLRVQLDGQEPVTLTVSAAQPAASAQLPLPRSGALHYRLSGYTEYADGSGRVPIAGEGRLDSGGAVYEVRTSAAGARDGLLFLQPVF